MKKEHPVIIEGISLSDDFVSHPLLGEFRRSTIRRAPLPGEYYLGDFSIGICLCGGDVRSEHEILELVKSPT